MKYCIKGSFYSAHNRKEMKNKTMYEQEALMIYFLLKKERDKQMF